MTAAPPFRRIRIPRPEGDLSVVTEGDAGPPVLLLSGAGSDNAVLSWRHLIPDLATDHRVIAPDWPKQGHSRPWDGHADHQALLEVVVGVLDHLQVEQAAVVGLSQGGAMTLATAIEHPDRVNRIVAIAPGGIISFPPVAHQVLWLTARSKFLNTTSWRYLLRTRKQVARFVRRSLIPEPVDDFDEIVDQVLAEMRERGASGGSYSSDWQNASIGPWRMNVDLRPDLGRISCPALFLQGDRDVGIRPKYTINAAAQVPGARLEILEGNGHWPNRQSPDRVNTLIREFLKETASTNT